MALIAVVVLWAVCGVFLVEEYRDYKNSSRTSFIQGIVIGVAFAILVAVVLHRLMA